MKFMNTKRFASTVMAGVLTLSLAVPAFAASTQPKNSTVVEGTYKEIPIAVEVPTTGTAQINPYGLPVTITKSDDKTVSLVGQKITTQPLSIKNQGTTKLDVNASVTVATKGDVSIGTTAGTDKTIAVSLEVAPMSDDTLAVASDSEKLADLLIDKFADAASWKNAAKVNVTAADTAADSANTLAVLGAVTPKAEGFNYSKNSIALFRLTGDLAAEPEDTSGAADPWKETDGFTATVVFKFTPHADVAASVTLDKTTLSLDSTTNSNGTITATFDAGESGLTVTGYAWTSSAPTVASVAGTTVTGAVTYVTTGTANITCTATLSDGSTVTSSAYVVTCA